MKHEQSAWRFLTTWLAIGLQSFGGGVATFALIKEAAVTRHRWMTDEEFAYEWSLVQLAPGINLLALTLLIGRRARGASGMWMAVLGLLLPTVALTILITAGYSRIAHLSKVQAAFHGMLPAIVALGFLTSIQMAVPLFRASGKEGALSVAACLLVIVASIAAAALTRLPVIAVLFGGGAICAVAAFLCKRYRHQSAAP